MMRRVLTHTAGAVVLLLACTPTEPCACPPARTSVILYGEVRTADGAAAAGAALEYVLALPAGGPEGRDLCELDPAASDAEPTGARADVSGRFRTQIFSLFAPATRCLRVTASAAIGSARVESLLVPFRLAQPDSVGLVLTLR
jgi:hypothetical protein